MVDLAEGAFLPADADDSFNADTLEWFNDKMNSILDGVELTDSRFSGINVCVYDSSNGKMGTPYPRDGFISDNIVTYKYKIKGEHCRGGDEQIC